MRNEREFCSANTPLNTEDEIAWLEHNIENAPNRLAEMKAKLKEARTKQASETQKQSIAESIKRNKDLMDSIREIAIFIENVNKYKTWFTYMVPQERAIWVQFAEERIKALAAAVDPEVTTQNEGPYDEF